MFLVNFLKLRLFSGDRRFPTTKTTITHTFLICVIAKCGCLQCWITPAGNLCIQKFQISNFLFIFFLFCVTFFINSILVYTSFTAFFFSTSSSFVLFIATGNSFLFFSCECVCLRFLLKYQFSCATVKRMGSSILR